MIYDDGAYTTDQMEAMAIRLHREYVGLCEFNAQRACPRDLIAISFRHRNESRYAMIHAAVRASCHRRFQ